MRASLIWITGLSGSGKSSLANAIHYNLTHMSVNCIVLDGDSVRRGLSKDLGFSHDDRIEHMRRVMEVAKLLLDQNVTVIAAFITPYRIMRQQIRDCVGLDRYIECYLDRPLDMCVREDAKGLYKAAAQGEIEHMTGINDAYEVPENPNVVVYTGICTLEHGVAKVIEYLCQHANL